MLCPGKKFFFLFDADRFNHLKGSKGLIFLNLFRCLNVPDSGALPNNPEEA